MKKLLCLSLFFSTAAISQPFVVFNEKQNIVYCGVDNPLLVAGYPCASVVLTTDNGKIEKTSCGQFNYKPEQLGYTTIGVWIKRGKKLKKAGGWQFRCKRLPLPTAFIGISTGGAIDISTLIKMGGVRAQMLEFTVDAPYRIVSYLCIGMRNSQIMFYEKNEGASYNEVLIKNLQILKAGDHLLISNIIYKGPDDKDVILTPLEFIIAE